MQALRNFITEENRWQSMWNSNYPQLDLATSTGRANIAERLSDQLSPENLHCDGEISQAEAQRKYNYYGKVIKELEAYCLSNWLNTPVVEEFY